MKNILILSFVGGLLLVFGAAALIVNSLMFVPAAGVVMYVPEALSEIE